MARRAQVCERRHVFHGQEQVDVPDRELNSTLYGNEVDYIIFFLSLVKNMLCKNRYCKKGFNLIPFSYKLVVRRTQVRERRDMFHSQEQVDVPDGTDRAEPRALDRQRVCGVPPSPQTSLYYV